MKDSTLWSALKRAEKADRPAITKADRAVFKALNAEAVAYDLSKRVVRLEKGNELLRLTLVDMSKLMVASWRMLGGILEGNDSPKVASGADFKARTHKVYVTSSKHNINSATLLIGNGVQKQQLPKPRVKKTPPASPGGGP